ncbi:MAG TPA: protein-L-isoaspartate(D-aspartate) O-methyltransferase [Patescibacteria group bacterium]|nr:protein-L-isoaspartate(D-aspartate) O-methyltransferase [Patescibacteria group bacterium]
MSDNHYSLLRKRLVEEYVKPAGVTDRRILNAVATVPRHAFVPRQFRKDAYRDIPLPIGNGQTISQPSLVALMTQYLLLQRDTTVLEIGTGSGYQAAILSLLAKKVYTIERITTLAKRALRNLKKLTYSNVEVIAANGTLGLPEKAPFDGIIVTAGAPEIPQTLIDQLKEGGHVVIPVGRSQMDQQLLVGVKKKGKLTTKIVESVRFVPLIGEKGWQTD